MGHLLVPLMDLMILNCRLASHLDLMIMDCHLALVIMDQQNLGFH